MVKYLCSCLLGLMGLLGCATAQIPVFINEVHYDNTGADVGEGVEIAGPAGTNLACFRIYLYNGAVPGAAVVYDSIMLSGVIPDQCNGFGTLNFPVNAPAQLQNGGNDGFALVFNPLFSGCATPGLPTVVQVLSYEGAFTCANGPAIGLTSTDLGVNEASGSAVGLSLQLSGAGVLAGDFTWVPSATATPGAINNNQTFGGPVCGTGPVIPTELRFRNSPSGCLLPGGTFSIQVCATNSAGFTAISYNNPITLSVISGPGVLSGVATQPAIFGCATFTGLSLSAVGTYQIRATDGVWADTSQFIYVSPQCATCPNLNAVLVDACGVQEGRNEILFFSTGDYAIPVSPTAFSINYGSTPTPSVGYTNSISSNQSYINALNAMAGCSLFHDALSNSPIPPNTNFIVMSNIPLTTYNFAAWCSLGSVYVIFSSDPDWDTTSGNWKNCLDCAPLGSGTTPRYWNTNFSGLSGGAGCNFTYNYTPCTDLLCNGNGDGIDFGYGGGTPTANWTECTPQSVLAVEFGQSLLALREGADVRLSWQTSMEANSSHFRIERSSSPAGPFFTVGIAAAAGNSSVPQGYAYRDVSAPTSQLWYRLAEVDLNGTVSYSGVAVVNAWDAAPELDVLHQGSTYTFDVTGHGAVQVRLFDVNGRQLKVVDGEPGSTDVDLGGLPAGVYLYRVTVGAHAFTGKLLLAD